MTGARHNIRQLVERLDLIGDDPAHGRGCSLSPAAGRWRCGGLPRALPPARAGFPGNAPHLRCRRLEPRRRLAENILDLRARLLIGRLEELSRALALVADRNADIAELPLDLARRRLRRIGQIRTDLLRSRFGAAEGFIDQILERAHHRVEFLAPVRHLGQQTFDRRTALVERAVKLRLKRDRSAAASARASCCCAST